MNFSAGNTNCYQFLLYVILPLRLGEVRIRGSHLVALMDSQLDDVESIYSGSTGSCEFFFNLTNLGSASAPNRYTRRRGSAEIRQGNFICL